MSWLYETFRQPSEKNGLIVGRRSFGVWSVTVDGYDQSTPYIRTMWRRALKRVPRHPVVRQVLLLGLGAGSIVRDLHRRFPGCRVTAIEWDPEMVALSRRLQAYPPTEAPEVLVGDALEIVPKLGRTFDLIVFDLYRGQNPEPRIAGAAFQQALRDHLAPHGSLLMNVFKTRSLFDATDAFFSRHRTWQYQFNHLALYRHFGMGNPGDPLPSGYVPFRSDEAFLRREEKSNPLFHVIGRPGCFGKMWHHGPFHFEGYTSNEEPIIDTTGPRRLVIWQPINRLDKPEGWHRSWAQMNPYKTGYAVIEDAERFWKNWSEHAQRHRKRFLQDEKYGIEEVSYEKFRAAYARSDKLPSMKRLYLDLIERRHRSNGELMHFFAAKEKGTGEIIAGLVVQDIPESHQSVHVIAFFLPKAAHTSVNVGLIDFWFRHAIVKGICFLDFDLFWAPGEPRAWKGFSRFKSQFGTHFIRYPNPLIRFVGFGRVR